LVLSSERGTETTPPDPSAKPRRLRAVDVIDKLLERPTTTHRPTFKIAQVKGVGGALVFEWDVTVPVCDEYPTSDEAFNAARAFAAELRREYGGEQTDAELREKLERSVEKVRGK
jgi:hypothetical protein